MQKRQLILDTYKTAEDGQWTLASCKITKAAQVQHFEEVPGRFAPLDLSTILTDGQPYYGSAQLDAVLESSEGTRAERQERITEMVNLLDGRSVKIVHPDHPDGYMVGRVEIRPDFNGLAYSQVTVSAVLEPWRYNAEETRVTASLPHYEEGKNLFDESQITHAANSGTASEAYGVVQDGVLIAKMGYHNYGITWKPFAMSLGVGTYTISADCYISTGGAPNLRVVARLYNVKTQAHTSATVMSLSAFDKWERISAQITLTEPSDYMLCVQGVGNADLSSNMDVRFKNICVAKGNIAEYSPYTTAGGANLLDIPDASTSGTIAYHQIMLGDFELPPGEYTISAKYKHIGEQRGSLDIREYENTSGYLKSIPIYANTSGETSATFTVPEGVKGIRVYLYSNVSGTAGATSVTLSEVMVNKGASALPYEPWYLLGDQLLDLTNAGKLAVVPLVDVVGEITLKYGDTTHTLSTGKYQLPGLYLTPDGGPARPAAHLVECSGAGTATFTYREAVLAE